MSRKANISMNNALYSWLENVASKIGARSVPGVARDILTAVMRASASPDAASGMAAVIGSLQPDDGDDDDSIFISSMMRELSDADRRDPGQRVNINRRY